MVLSVRSRLLDQSVHELSAEVFGELESGRQTFPQSDIPDALISLHAAALSSIEVSRGKLRPFLHTHPARTPVVLVRQNVSSRLMLEN